MTYPKRYSAFYTLRNGDTGLASFGVEPRDDGIYVEHSEYWKLFEEVTRLKAEVERLTAFTTRTIIPNEELQAENARLKAEVERLRFIGDKINMWGVVAPYVVPPCIDKYAAKEGKQP